ncbi:shikimate kinase [Flavobacterium macrobrachii]|jgi:shikimate kinase|uniref:Shikimate kinase n=1 Tax=Flavobacterium macrobrachii TaxID=591204 RepID=A0ABS2CYQ9_9FLAO|nr:shikimate kinase [Flavobacterium macrobrachii]MBM6499317.1 AAA family ATPase [Flavobacterium macrobrachii]PZO29497.1 MAG: shikimate kinase [Flavobacteriaceae bacterium]
MDKVVLIGYMGSGKSIVGLELAKKLKINHFDLDDLIEKSQGLTVSDIFKQKGEIFFRKKEHEIFTQKIASKQDFVLSTGGGTPCYYNNHLMFEEKNVQTIHLKASVDTIVQRIIKEKHKRPLVQNLSDDDLKEYIAKHLFERNFYYNKAKFIITVDSKSINQIVNEIIELLK